MLKVVDLLRWKSDPALLVTAQSEFVSFQARALATRVAQLDALDRPLATHLKELLVLNRGENVFRVILAPEVTARLRRDSEAEIRDAGAVLARGLETEAAAAGPEVTLSGPSWTALGDRLVHPTREVVTPAAVPGCPPLDVASPQACSIDPESALCLTTAKRAPLAGEELQTVVGLLDQVQQRIAAVAPVAHAMIRGCGVVLVVVNAPGTRLGSSTHGLHVGRITMASGDWGRVGVEDAADALIHEAIHCLLLMLDYDRPMLVDDQAADHLPKLESPWTGKPLPLPTYLHAVFVWFGLVHFWQRAMTRDAFRRDECARLLRRAAAGFTRGSVLDGFNEDHHALTSPHVKVAIARMERTMHRPTGSRAAR